MKKIVRLTTIFLSGYLFLQTALFAQEPQNILDELNPRDPNIEKMLDFYDYEYFKNTNESPFVEMGPVEKGSCFRSACPVWVSVNKAKQTMELYIDGVETYNWKVSTGRVGYTTPDFDRNPNGRVYDNYSSQIYPGGDYNGLGNMPYAVFISGGYAIHGTIKANWPKLGTRASAGCIRLHPDHAYIFNRLVRAHGIGSVWVTVE